ncbi:hypothetical protein PVAP13_3NG299400 [Panicum virgatum]|uniref:Uncharacterized protein n=1 Tax=Panicum virgatum TaxID=38727 RepID=A0A8T0UH76_PANVG|nr:hypothetical protein PVAP13_3NG299400 [Panicum virgatum]
MQLGRKYHSMTNIPDLDSYKNCHINVPIFMSCKSSIFLQNHRAAGTENIPSFISISRSMCDAFCDLNRPGIRAWSETCRTLPILLNLGSLTERSLTLKFALIRPLASPFGKEVRIRIKWEISISALDEGNIPVSEPIPSSILIDKCHEQSDREFNTKVDLGGDQML